MPDRTAALSTPLRSKRKGGIGQFVPKEVLGVQSLTQLPELDEIESLSVVLLQICEPGRALVEIQVNLRPVEGPAILKGLVRVLLGKHGTCP